ncbi:hypothetical protein BS47DRAFT_1368390 [Hydnum rufescens UP504]|uniref:Uncharacterized protein n=1 Tax=Hydnum rufescens UP504 TaxID=1448309 RepID=A0A9P6AFY2_9AGAM|nr:hypothetical protein BS47DRAFT_1368390 [Hydnum rufescens UP504]
MTGYPIFVAVRDQGYYINRLQEMIPMGVPGLVAASEGIPWRTGCSTLPFPQVDMFWVDRIDVKPTVWGIVYRDESPPPRSNGTMGLPYNATRPPRVTLISEMATEIIPMRRRSTMPKLGMSKVSFRRVLVMILGPQPKDYQGTRVCNPKSFVRNNQENTTRTFQGVLVWDRQNRETVGTGEDECSSQSCCPQVERNAETVAAPRHNNNANSPYLNEYDLIMRTMFLVYSRALHPSIPGRNGSPTAAQFRVVPSRIQTAFPMFVSSQSASKPTKTVVEARGSSHPVAIMNDVSLSPVSYDDNNVKLYHDRSVLMTRTTSTGHSRIPYPGIESLARRCRPIEDYFGGSQKRAQTVMDVLVGRRTTLWNCFQPDPGENVTAQPRVWSNPSEDTGPEGVSRTIRPMMNPETHGGVSIGIQGYVVLVIFEPKWIQRSSQPEHSVTTSCPQFDPGHTKLSRTCEDSPLTLMRETGWPGAAILMNETPEPGHDVVEPGKPNIIDERVTRTEFGSYGVVQAPMQVNLSQDPNAHKARPKQRDGLGSSLEPIVQTTPKSFCPQIEDPQLNKIMGLPYDVASLDGYAPRIASHGLGLPTTKPMDLSHLQILPKPGILPKLNGTATHTGPPTYELVAGPKSDLVVRNHTIPQGLPGLEATAGFYKMIQNGGIILFDFKNIDTGLLRDRTCIWEDDIVDLIFETVIEYCTPRCAYEPLDTFVSGLNELTPQELISASNEHELEFVGGMFDTDVGEPSKDMPKPSGSVSRSNQPVIEMVKYWHSVIITSGVEKNQPRELLQNAIRTLESFILPHGATEPAGASRKDGYISQDSTPNSSSILNKEEERNYGFLLRAPTVLPSSHKHQVPIHTDSQDTTGDDLTRTYEVKPKQDSKFGDLIQDSHSRFVIARNRDKDGFQEILPMGLAAQPTLQPIESPVLPYNITSGSPMSKPGMRERVHNPKLLARDNQESAIRRSQGDLVWDHRTNETVGTGKDKYPLRSYYPQGPTKPTSRSGYLQSTSLDVYHVVSPYKTILKRKITPSDLENIDMDLFHDMNRILENGTGNLIIETIIEYRISRRSPLMSLTNMSSNSVLMWFWQVVRNWPAKYKSKLGQPATEALQTLTVAQNPVEYHHSRGDEYPSRYYNDAWLPQLNEATVSLTKLRQEPANNQRTRVCSFAWFACYSKKVEYQRFPYHRNVQGAKRGQLSDQFAVVELDIRRGFQRICYSTTIADTGAKEDSSYEVPQGFVISPSADSIAILHCTFVIRHRGYSPPHGIMTNSDLKFSIVRLKNRGQEPNSIPRRS